MIQMHFVKVEANEIPTRGRKSGYIALVEEFLASDAQTARVEWDKNDRKPKHMVGVATTIRKVVKQNFEGKVKVHNSQDAVYLSRTNA